VARGGVGTRYQQASETEKCEWGQGRLGAVESRRPYAHAGDERYITNRRCFSQAV